MIRKFLALLFVAGAICSAVIAETPRTFVPRKEALAAAAKVTRQAYPDADTVLVEDYEFIKYNADGTAVSTDEMYEKILTEKGRRENSEITLWFTLPYSTISVPVLEIIKADGKVVKVDVKKNSKVMVNPSQMSQNIYNPNSKIMKISVPDLQIGDIIHIIWKRTTVQARMKGIWCSWFTLQSTNPIGRYVVEISAPKTRPLQKYMIKDPVKGSIKFKKSERNGRIIYKWTATNVPRIFPEPDMPPFYTVSQRLLVSTAKSWGEISKWYWNISKPHLDKTTPEMKKKVAELIKGKKTREEKIYAIFQFVAKKIRYMGITTEKVAPGNEPHDVDITFNNRYGVCRDKAALLVAMMRIAGYKSYPVLFYNGPKKDSEVPNNYFNHAIVSVMEPNGEYLLMDPTDETTAELLPTYLSDKSYLPSTPNGETLMTSAINPATKNMLVVKSTGKVAADGTVTIDTDMKFSGINDNVYRGAFSRWKKERVRQFIASRLKSVVAGAVLKSLDITPANLRNMKEPLRVKFSFSANNFLVKSTENTVLSPPWLGSYFGVVNFLLRGSAGLNKRSFPLKLYSTCGVKESFKLTLPQKFKIDAMPKYQGVDTATLGWNRNMQVKGNQVSGGSEFYIKAMEFKPKQYLELKELLKRIEFEKRKLLIMQNPPLSDYPGAEVVILNERSDITIESDSEWVLRKYMKKKILTYAGVKNNSELKFRYNPAWRTVKIIKARTISPDGKVKKLNDKELNIMDAGWVASAPRYPAEKIMVASLPGVQIGSVIEYEVEHHFTRQPFFSTIALFQKTDPIEKKVLSIDNPGKLPYKTQFSISRETISDSTRTWVEKNVKPIKSESNSPPLWSFAKSMLVSNGNWATYAAKLNAAFEKAVKQNDKASDLAQELVKDYGIGFWSQLFSSKNDRKQAVIIIRDWVAKNIRSTGPGLNDLPLSAISPADVTLKDRYGNSADQAILLTAMLRAVGFETELVPVSHYYPIREIWGAVSAYPQPVFSTVLASVKLGDEIYYLNDTSQYAKLGTVAHNNKMGIDLRNGNIVLIRNITEELDQHQPRTAKTGKADFTIDYAIQLQPNGMAQISRKLSCRKTYYESKKRLYSEITPEKRRRRHQTLVAAIAQSARPASSLKTNFKVYPGIESFRVKVPGFAVDDGNYYYFKLPGMDMLKSLVRVAGESRENPYLVNSDYRFSINYTITLPPGYEMTAMKTASQILNAPGTSVSIRTRAGTKAGTYKISVRCAHNPTWLKAVRYSQLVTLNAKLNNPKLSLIILKKKTDKK
jgi:transglutaminase-like putative cysteine protease